MSGFTVVFLLLAALWLVLGVRTVRRDRRNGSYVLFGALCLTMVVWNFFLGIGYSLKDTGQIELLLKIAYVGGFLFSPVNLHFFLVISKVRVKPIYLVVSYLPSVALLIANFAHFFIFSSYERRYDEWYGILDSGSTLVRVYIILVLLTFVISLLVIASWSRRTRINKEKIQARIILAIFTLTYFASLVGTLILPFFGVHDYQPVGVTLLATYIIGLYLLIRRFRLMSFRRTVPAEEIIASIGDFVFLLDDELKIQEVNDAVKMLFPGASEKLRDRSFREIVGDNEELAGRARAALAGEAGSFSTIATYKTDSATFPAKTFVSVTKDRFNDASGFLVIAREVKEVDQFQKRFKLTSRELQIVGLIVSGSSYREISEALGISEKTVERHLTNVYNKIGIGNKIELFRIAAEYNV